MKWIGLTGSLGTGKSTAADFLRRRGYPVIDADQIAKEVIAPGTPGLKSVIDEFGPGVLAPDQSLDRAKMAAIVFSDPAKLSKLESLIHPLVQDRVREIRKALQGQGFQLAFYDVPLLFEKNLTGFDHIVTVTADPVEQRARLLVRNSWTNEEIDRRLATQWPQAKKVAGSDFVVDNSGDLTHLEREIDALLKKLI